MPLLLRSLSTLYRRSSNTSTHLPRPLCTVTMSSTPTSATSNPSPVTPSATRVGWIGTGVMGRSMASHILSAGYSLTVFNRTPSKAQSLLQMGARLADSPLAVAQSSDVVFLIVGYPSDVRRVAIDPACGALAGLAPGSVLVDMTTSDPALAAEIAEAARARSVQSIDAPVSGGDRGAREGTLSIFAGGDEVAVRRLAPLFKCMGTVHYMGGPGAGQRAKLGNQIAIASTMVGLVEGMMYAHKAGLDVGRWMEAISTGAAGSKSLELYGKRILARDMAAGFYVHHFVKDLGICLKECQEMGLALPGLALAQQLYLSLVAHGEGGLGTQALILAIERLNNTELGGKSPQQSVSCLKVESEGIKAVPLRGERIMWTAKAAKTFRELCVEQVKKGNKSGYSLSAQAWYEVGTEFSAIMGYSLSKDKFKNRWDGMHKEYKEWIALKNLRGNFGWDYKKNTLAANRDWWKDYVKRHPKAGMFRHHGLEYEEEYDLLFARPVGSGEPAFDSSVEPTQENVDCSEAEQSFYQPPSPTAGTSSCDPLPNEDIPCSHNDDDALHSPVWQNKTKDYCDNYIAECETPLPEKQREETLSSDRKKRRLTGKHITSTLEELVSEYRESRRARSEDALRNPTLDDEMAEVHALLGELEGIGDSGALRFFAMSQLLDPARRSLFKNMKPELRLGWLEFEYSMFKVQQPAKLNG